VSPVSTRPLVTAPPSALLTEVTDAYKAAYADVAAAGAISDPAYPKLTEHIALGQLERLVAFLEEQQREGIVNRQPVPTRSWIRVEGLTVLAEDVVGLEVCNFDDAVATKVATGEEVDRGTMPDRYIETMRKIDGVWKWTARDWIDSAKGNGTDCALQ
jgi:hypothetical protein